MAEPATEVTVTVPGLLARFTEGRRTVRVRADTVRGAIDRLVASYPALEPHVFDGVGRLRPHLGVYRNGNGVAWAAAQDVALEAGDELLVLQAVSGG